MSAILSAIRIYAGFFGVKPNDIQRDIRITYLIESLLDAVDERGLSLMCGVAISYYDAETQILFFGAAANWKLAVDRRHNAARKKLTYRRMCHQLFLEKHDS